MSQANSGAANPPSEPTPPEVPNHRLYHRIGRGSYGEVWLAIDAMNKWRAVKVVHRRETGQADRGYQREFEAIKRYEEVSHTHGSLVPILTVGRESGDRFFYYSMELADHARPDDQLEAIDPSSGPVEGFIARYAPRTMRAELRRRGRLLPSECVEYAIALATALEQLHSRKLIHRDVKPENIIFVHGWPKLADVGLVADVSATYSLAGTNAYLSPEVPRKEPADIFALGKVLYEMVTGRDVEEFPALNDFANLSADEQAGVNELSAVFCKASDPEVSGRHPSARHLREELEFLKSKGSVLRLRELEELERVRQREEAERKRRNRVRLRFAAAAGLVVLVGGLAFFLWMAGQRATEQDRRRELREIQIYRTRYRHAGWFTNNWSRLKGAAAVRKDREVLEQATAILAGLDARPIKVLEDVPVASAAFGPEGRLLIGGVGTNAPTLLLDTNGVMTELTARAKGPVCWTTEGVPLQFLATSNGLVLWEAHTRIVRRTFPFPASETNNPDSSVLAVTPDGSRVTAALGGRVLTWNTGTGELLGELRTRATALAFSPDGSLLGTGGVDGTIRVFALPNLAEVAVLPPALRGSPIFCLAFARDRLVRYGVERGTNSWLLAAGDKGAGIVIWDVKRRLPRSFCRGSTWIVGAVAFSPDGLTLASAGRNQPYLWDIMSGQPLLQFTESSAGTSSALAFDATGRRLVCGGLAGEGQATTALWELEQHRGIQTLRGLASPVRKVWFSPNSQRTAALSDDWHLALWDVGSGRLLYMFETPIGAFADKAGGCFDASGENFAFASGREAYLYDVRSGEVLRKWRLKDGWSDQLQFNSRGQLLLLRRERASAQHKYIWRLYELNATETPVLLHEQTETNWSTEDTILAPGGERFLVWSGGPSGTARIIRGYDAASGKEVWKSVTKRTNGELRIRLDPTGRYFGYTPYALGLRLHLKRFSDFGDMGTTAEGYHAIGPSGQEFAGAGWFFPDRTGTKHGVPLAAEWGSLPDTPAFSPNGKLLAWGTTEGVVLVADIQTVLRRLAELR